MSTAKQQISALLAVKTPAILDFWKSSYDLACHNAGETMTFTEVLDLLRNHPIVAVITGLSAAAAAGWTVNVAVNSARMAEYDELKKKHAACDLSPLCPAKDQPAVRRLPGGDEIVFPTLVLMSEKLVNRTKIATDPAWDNRCVRSAKDALQTMGFALKLVDSTSAARGELNQMHLGVLCSSYHNVAVIYGVGQKTESAQLEIYREELGRQLKERLKDLL